MEEATLELDRDTVTVVDHGTHIGAALHSAFDADVGSPVFAGVGAQVADKLPEPQTVSTHHSWFTLDIDGRSGAGQRVFHAVPVIYKGSGFYTTDYGRPKPPAENGGKESSDKESSDKESSDKKPASKDSSATSSSSTESKASSSEGSSGATESKTGSSAKTTKESGS